MRTKPPGLTEVGGEVLGGFEFFGLDARACRSTRSREINAQRVSAVADAHTFGALPRTESGYWMLSIPGHSQLVPLEVILVHELGHVLGLKEVCVIGVCVTGQPRFGECTGALPNASPRRKRRHERLYVFAVLGYDFCAIKPWSGCRERLGNG